MPELQALCPACRRPLDGDLVVSRCNHVFHRACLVDESLRQCPKCGEQSLRENAQNLFGLSFSAGPDPGAARLAAAEAEGDSDSDVVVDSVDARVMRTVARICVAQDMVRDGERKLDEKRKEVAEAAARASQEHKRLADEEKRCKRLIASLDKQREDKAAADRRHESLHQELNQLRIRDTVLEYAEQLRRDGEDAALDFLHKMLKIVTEPARILVDMSRLRGHHHNKTLDWLKESGATKNVLKKLRRELQELDAKLLRAGEARGEVRPPASPQVGAAKRARR